VNSTESFEIFWLELLVTQVGHDSASFDLLFLPHPHLCKNSNGDMGVIAAIDLEDQEVTVEFAERQVNYDYADMNEITLAWSVPAFLTKSGKMRH